MSSPRAGGHAGRSFIAWLAIILLTGALVWLASERNAHQYFLVSEDGQLTVKQGLLAPIGRQAFKTDDPQLAQAYAPVSPPAGAQLPPEQAFDDRASLDQALYELLARWARSDIQTARPELLERGLAFVARAERLPGISQAQREDLRALRAESGFYEGRQLLQRSEEALRQAREQLQLSAHSASPRAGDAAQALTATEPLLDQLHRAVRLLAPGGSGSEAPVPAQPEPTPPSAAGR